MFPAYREHKFSDRRGLRIREAGQARHLLDQLTVWRLEYAGTGVARIVGGTTSIANGIMVSLDLEEFRSYLKVL